MTYWDEVDREAPTALERDRERETEELRHWYEAIMADYIRDLERDLEDGWREDIARQDAEQQALADDERHNRGEIYYD